MSNIQCSVVNPDIVQQKIKQAQKAIQKISPDVLSKAMVNYSEVASRNMPPPVKGTKGRSIPAKLYKRQVLSIDQMYKKTNSPRIKNFLIHQKIKGFKFAVWVYFNRGKNKRLQFGKSERELKSKYGRIKYRGLFKWLWGANFSQIGQTTPTMFSRLLQKSPDLAKKADLSALSKKQTANETEIISDYKAEGVEYFAKSANYQAKKAMKSKLKKLFQVGLSKQIKKIK